MIAEISMWPPSSRPVTAVIVHSPVMGVPEFVMNAFDPLMTHCPSSSFAVVLVAPASLPPPGSVRPNDPRMSPRAIGTSQRCFCFSVPNRKMGFAPSPTPASSVMAIEESTRPSSSIAMHSVRKSAPCPPYSSGNGNPNSPISPICFTMSMGSSPRSSISAARGATTSSANSRIAARKSSWSCVRSKSMAELYRLARNRLPRSLAHPGWARMERRIADALRFPPASNIVTIGVSLGERSDDGGGTGRGRGHPGGDGAVRRPAAAAAGGGLALARGGVVHAGAARASPGVHRLGDLLHRRRRGGGGDRRLGAGPPRPGGLLRRGLDAPRRAAHGRRRGRRPAAVPGAGRARRRGIPEDPSHRDVPDDAVPGAAPPPGQPVAGLTPGRMATAGAPDDRPYPPGRYPVVVVGSGPGAIQTGYSLGRLGVEHAVISADDAPGGMFRWFPLFQRLITWTKPYAPAERGTREYECAAAVFAVGMTDPWTAPVPGLEQATHYVDTRPAPEYAGKRVFIVGKRNSGFEIADGLLPWARQVILGSPRPARLSILVHSTAAARARYLQPYEDHVLGGGKLVLDAAIQNVERQGGGWRVRASGTTRPGDLVFDVDEVIAATGFRTPLGDLPDLGVATFFQGGRLPAQTPYWESASVPGIYFAGNITQGSIGMKKYGIPSNSAAVHGFRYNASVLAEHLARTMFGIERDRPVLRPQEVVPYLLAEATAAPELWNQQSYLTRVLEADPARGITDAGIHPLAHFVDASGPDAVAIAVETDAEGDRHPAVYVRREGRVEEHLLDGDPLDDFAGPGHRAQLSVLLGDLVE